MTRQFFVYILSSCSHNIYVGVTNNLALRVSQHKQGSGSAFTARYRIRRLVYYEAYSDVREAIAREKQIKGWDRAKRVALIEAANPAWDNLSAGLV